ncbi:hypothetical protein [Streptomyces sp. bgisy060]|uniref:hypothetical protein n=1 Tax=Streptomyces sp. bgisy060 TaxID=3413775 RepID=UPI003EB87623
MHPIGEGLNHQWNKASTVIYRNFNAPARAFTPFSHEIIRHPRLSSDAVRLLTWQLSLPRDARESLSRSAERARIGACAFGRAKRQLKEEGFLHERRVQVAGGRWTTQQLVSATPLTAGEAAKIFARLAVSVTGSAVAGAAGEPAARGRGDHAGSAGRGGRVPPAVPPAAGASAPEPRAPEPPTPTQLPPEPPAPSTPSAPGPRKPGVGDPAVGAPVTPRTDGHPEKDPGEKTSHHPAGATEAAGGSGEAGGAWEAQGPEESGGAAHLEAGRAFVGALPLLSPALRHVPPGMREELAGLVARWLADGHSPADVQAHVLRGLPGDGTPVRRPGGLVRHLLREVPPLELPPAPASGPRVSARLAGARECSGEHTQATLFRPVADETLCRACAP